MARFKFNKRMKLLAIQMSIIAIMNSVIYGEIASAGEVRNAQITNIKGEAKVFIQGGEKPIDAFEGMNLLEGDTIIVGKNSQVSFSIDDDKEIIISENNQMTLTELSGKQLNDTSKTRLSLWSGKIWCEIKNKLKGESKFEIKASSTVMGVRGTKFYVDFYDKDINVGVLEGVVDAITSINVKDKDGKAIIKEIETVLDKNKQMYINENNIDEKIKDNKKIDVNSILKETMDLFVLEIIKENPENINAELLEGIDKVIETKRAEKKTNNENQEKGVVPIRKYMDDYINEDDNDENRNNQDNIQIAQNILNRNELVENTILQGNTVEVNQNTNINQQNGNIEPINQNINENTERDIRPQENITQDNNIDLGKNTNKEEKKLEENNTSDNNTTPQENTKSKENKKSEENIKPDNNIIPDKNTAKIESVNNASTKEKMKEALESLELGLDLGREYLGLTTEKLLVAEKVLSERSSTGYTDKASVQTAFNEAVTLVIREKAEAEAKAEEEAKLAEALLKVNNATTKEEMKVALESVDLGLNLGSDYSALTTEKLLVVEKVLNGKPANGYTDKVSIQTVFDGAVTEIIREKNMPAQPEVSLSFNTDGTININGANNTMEYQISSDTWKDIEQFTTEELLEYTDDLIEINIRVKAQIGEGGHESGKIKTLTISNNNFYTNTSYGAVVKKEADLYTIESLNNTNNIWIKIGENDWKKYGLVNNKVSINTTESIRVKYVEDNFINELKLLTINNVVIAPLAYDNYIQFNMDNENNDVKFHIAAIYSSEAERYSINTAQDIDDIINSYDNFGFAEYLINDVMKYEDNYRCKNYWSGDMIAYIIAEYKNKKYLVYVSEKFSNKIIMTVEGQGTVNSANDSYDMRQALESGWLNLNFEKGYETLTDQEKLIVAEKMIALRPSQGYPDRKSIIEGFNLAVSEIITSGTEIAIPNLIDTSVENINISNTENINSNKVDNVSDSGNASIGEAENINDAEKSSTSEITNDIKTSNINEVNNNTNEEISIINESNNTIVPDQN